MTDKTKNRIDWRVLLGASLTAIWIGAGVIYLVGKVGVMNFVDLPTGEIGSFLEGAFAPLAFLWLVIGHFMQQTEISANTQAVQLQEQSAQRQELHSRRNGYFKLLSLVQEQLGAIAGFHYVSVCGDTGSQEITTDDYASMRAESAQDSALFVRKMVGLAARNTDDREKIQEIFFGTDIRARHSANFESTFDKLLRNAKAVDQDDMVMNALLFGSPFGMLYRIIRTTQGKEEINPLTGFATVQGVNHDKSS